MQECVVSFLVLIDIQQVTLCYLVEFVQDIKKAKN